MPAARPLKDRFWEKVAKGDGCWLWLGARSKAGYGQIGLGRKVLYAHRLSAEWVHGPIPAGTEVCHKCDAPACVNPDHLFLGTHADNGADAASKGRMRPPRGEASPKAKLTAEQVVAIRRDTRTTRAIGRDYGVSNRHVSAIKRGEAWRDQCE